METVVTFFKGVVRFFREADMVILALSLASSILGVLLIGSAVTNRAGEAGAVDVQTGAIVLGMAFFLLFTYIDIDMIADKSRLLVVFSLLLLSTLLIWGVEEAGQRAWLRFFGIGMQPGEITKVPFIIVMAKMISMYKEQRTLNSILSLALIFAVFAIFFGAVFQISGDLGTALVYFGIFVIMLFAGGVKLRWFALGALVLTAAAPLVWENVLSERHRNVVMAPFFPDIVDPDRSDALWQTYLSIEAIATGGPFGQGLGNGRLTQAAIIPAHHTDFIFSVAGEELGFIGCIAIIALLTCVIARCFYVGVRSNNPLGMLVCTGVGAMFIVQSIMNIGMALGFLPVIGITLPFISYGGSSVVTCFAAMGIVSGIKMRPKPARFRHI
ncbi:MAG: FtsW/RodA/SpoVE family cell cycle protein [Oscillospiraceae bacterium]|nr:FtsW/RodA/SpoVE family cell cycle protein [Oscillospiraceae bacterium]MCL2277939.1 FtsW/RodA/SpoVE family cell cycle protein [Oscillospiraceae bacterium]